jgi:hypothetical protein
VVKASIISSSGLRGWRSPMVCGSTEGAARSLTSGQQQRTVPGPEADIWTPLPQDGSAFTECPAARASPARALAPTTWLDADPVLRVSSRPSRRCARQGARLVKKQSGESRGRPDQRSCQRPRVATISSWRDRRDEGRKTASRSNAAADGNPFESRRVLSASLGTGRFLLLEVGRPHSSHD